MLAAVLEAEVAACWPLGTDHPGRWLPGVRRILGAPAAGRQAARNTPQAFYDYPAGRWIRLRTTSPSSRPSPRLETGPKPPRGPAQRAAGIAMAVKLIQAPGNTSAPSAHPPPHRPRPCRARFECGKLAERDPYSGPPHPSGRRHPCSAARRLESTRRQRHVMIFIGES
jgi:hypothetical protein